MVIWIVYQQYLVISYRVGWATHSLYASSGPQAEGVPTNNQIGSGPCRLWWGLDKVLHIVLTPLLVRESATLQERFVQDRKRAKHKTYSPLDDRWVILTTTKAFHYFRARREEIRWAFDPPKFVNKITVDDRLNDSFWYIFLKRYCAKFGQKFRAWPKELLQRFPKLVISVTLCQQVWSDLNIFRVEIKNANYNI